MEILIVAVGLALCASGVVLAWYKKGAGIWASFVVGIALVLLGGPMNERLGKLALSESGLTVDFESERKIDPTADLSQRLENLRKETFEAVSKNQAFIQTIRSQLTAVTTEVTAVAERVGSAEEELYELDRIRSQLSKVGSLIESAKSALDWSAVVANVNDKLDVYEQLSARLVRERIPIADTFGSDKPNPFVLSFGSGVWSDHIRTLTTILIDYGLDALRYTDVVERSGEIYIGSYGYRNADKKVALLDAELHDQVLNQELSTDELVGLVASKSIVYAAR